MSGVPEHNKLQVERHVIEVGLWSAKRYRVTLTFERRDRFGLNERRQITFAEQTVVKALRRAGYMVVTPEEMKR